MPVLAGCTHPVPADQAVDRGDAQRRREATIGAAAGIRVANLAPLGSGHAVDECAELGRGRGRHHGRGCLTAGQLDASLGYVCSCRGPLQARHDSVHGRLCRRPDVDQGSGAIGNHLPRGSTLDPPAMTYTSRSGARSRRSARS